MNFYEKIARDLESQKRDVFLICPVGHCRHINNLARTECPMCGADLRLNVPDTSQFPDEKLDSLVCGNC